MCQLSVGSEREKAQFGRPEGLSRYRTDYIQCVEKDDRMWGRNAKRRGRANTSVIFVKGLVNFEARQTWAQTSILPPCVT